MGARIRVAGFAGLAVACLSPLDELGNDDTVVDHDTSQSQNGDDDIATKHPIFDPSLTTTEAFASCSVLLNKSASVTKLDIVPFDGGDKALAQTLYPTMTAAAKAAWSAPILPSMELVNQMLKAFNDGLYAAIELGVEDGSGGSPIDKRALLGDLATALDTRAHTGDRERVRTSEHEPRPRRIGRHMRRGARYLSGVG